MNQSILNNVLRIEAEDYQAGTNGVEYYDTTIGNQVGAYRNDDVDIGTVNDGGENYTVCYIKAGEYLTYEVEIAEAGVYDITLRVATERSGTKSIGVTTGEQSQTVSFGNTGGWNNYEDVTLSGINLQAGVQTLRLDMLSSSFNLDYIDIARQGEIAPDTTAPTANLLTTSLSLPTDSTSDAQLAIEYSDDTALDIDSLDDSDIVVTGTNGSLAASLVAVDTNSDGTPRQATYSLVAPPGGWQTSDSGSYTVEVIGDEVSDTNSNFMAGSSIGTLDLNVVTDAQQSALRLNVGGGEYTDIQGNTWQADRYFTGGESWTTTAGIFKTKDDPIYQSHRWAEDLVYEIPVSNGNYSLNLHFAETYFDDFKKRIFDIFAEGEPIIQDLDVFAKSKNAFFPGKNSALALNFTEISVSDGILDLELSGNINNSMLSGIEVVPLVGSQIILKQSQGDTKTAEDGNSDSYEVVLNSLPSADVTIELSVNQEQLITDKTELIFTAENWNVPQTVTVDAVDDDLAEGTETYNLVHTISSSDSDYNNLSVPNIPVTIADNDLVPIDFNTKTVATMTAPTRGAWGPDGRLYVGSYGGKINAYTFNDAYNVTEVQTINTLTSVSNPNILGIAFNPFSTAENPEIYVSHSLLYANGGESFPETELSPYSGQISVLSGTDFSTVTPLITGLPVSNQDHGVNGIEFDAQGDLLVSIGGNTNAGIPNDNIGGIAESPFSGAILKAEITEADFNGEIEYILPSDFVSPEELSFDPADSQYFGDIVDVAPDVDVSVYAYGLRNSFDLLLTTEGLLYATDNGANKNFGDVSTSATTQEPFTQDARDELNLIAENAYYGHPNRNLGRYDERLNVYHNYTEDSIAGVYTAPIATAPASTNGLDEYRATTFENQLRGNLLAQQWNSKLHSYKLTSDGQSVVQQEALTGITDGLDVLTGPGGAILGIDLSENSITVAIPDDVTAKEATAYDIFPWRAPAIGGQEFVIGGVGFGDINDTTVLIGEQPAEITYVSDTRIKGILPEQDLNDSLLDISVESAGVVSIISEAFLPLV